MCNRTARQQLSIAAQERMFRLAARDYGLSAKVLAAETGHKLPTIIAWANGTYRLPVDALADLSEVIPDELTSLMFDRVGKHIGSNEPGDADLDALGREGAGFVAAKLDAEADGVVTPIERAGLKDRARRIAARARAVAA